MVRLFVLGLALTYALCFLGACQQPPKTKIYRKSQQNFAALTKSLKRPIKINPQTLLLDARNAFDYGLSHAENSFNVQWDSYSTRKINQTSRRLSLLGVTPERPIIVLGNGKNGMAEEGRMAWLLMYLGVQDVQTSTLDALKLRRSKGEEMKPENASRWTPSPITGLIADAREVVGHAVGKKERNIHIIDVRSPKEYFEKDELEVRGVNIEWKEFFTKSGRPNIKIKKRLQSIGIKSKDRIVLVSNKGLRSGAVTYALTMMGYQNAGNFNAGWKSLK